MEIRFVQSPFFEQVTCLLRELSSLRFFDHGLLVGSWPMIVYADKFTLSYALTTDDIDFAISTAVRMPEAPKETIPELMERLGFSPIHDHSGIETFLQGTFEVEFLMHRKGGSAPPAVVVQPWKVSAQPLPFIDLLFIRPTVVVIEDFSIAIPSPESLLIHKLIIAQRRAGHDREAKKEKDLQQCAVLSTVAGAEEVQSIFDSYKMSNSVRRDMESSCAEGEVSVPGGLSWRR